MVTYNIKRLAFSDETFGLDKKWAHNLLDLMVENKLIKEKPKSLTNKTYFEIENKFRVLADKLEMSLAELDLYMWYMKTGEILK